MVKLKAHNCVIDCGSEDYRLADSPNRQGLLFVLIGPPGVGKNALMSDAMAHTLNLRQLATATTRGIRATEAIGREHLFVTVSEFHRMIEDNILLEWQQVHGNLYGIPRRTVEEAFARGNDLTADIDVLGATYLRSLYPDNVVLIFIKPPSLEELETRMRARGETDAAIATRMKRVEMEMTYAPLCDHIIINDDLGRAAAELNAIIAAERQRRIDGKPAARRYEHIATLIPVYGSEVLRPRESDRAQRPVAHGELPHLVALRLAQELFGVSASPAALLKSAPHEGSFVPPAALTVTPRNHVCSIDFAYLYLMSERIPALDGWAWESYDLAGLPVTMVEILNEQLIQRPE